MTERPGADGGRLALFGGPYGNPWALEAVLTDIAARGSATAWCLGDLAGFGPAPEACIARLRERRVPTVQGNVDHALGARLADCGCGYADPDDLRSSQASFDHADAQVSGASRAWLRALPREARLSFAGRRLLLCHGSPRRQNEFLWASSSSDAFLERLCETHEADVIACSHTGLHWHRALPGGRHVVNAGAIGRAAHDGRPGAWYAELVAAGDGLEVRFRHVAYDHESLARAILAAGLPPAFAETARTGWWTTCFGGMPSRERVHADDARAAGTGRRP
jgi:diadenosine tetraphosphatase ApaH/serine/threonine PP2A family protein phosphatase